VIEIHLNQGKVALLDDEDARWATYAWSAVRGPRDTTWYAVHAGARTSAGRPHLRLHRAILGVTGPRVRVDHINGNGLDNRRANLRIATNGQNMANRKPNRGTASGFKGVHWHPQRRKWQARVQALGIRRSLGLFDTAAEAARAYDVAARETFGEFARLNSPVTP
jgi:hypothetical protein